jgi:hypothetical protein
MEQAILLLTNKTDFVVRDRYDKLVREYGDKADVFLLFDNSISVDSRELKGFKRIYTFSIQELVNEGYCALEGGFLGNCHYPILRFHRDYPVYDFCWLVEDDVVFSGDWSTLFDAYANDNADLITSKIRNYSDNPNWYWWKSVNTPKEETLSENELYASFNPIFRLSSKALECLEIEMRKGWYGHYEALVPTIITKYALKMRDMGGKGKFVKDEDENRFYTEDTHTWTPLRVQIIMPNMIYHPIKEKISRKEYRKNCLLSVVGEHSNHKVWITGDADRNFDVHLIVYDFSFKTHYEGGDFIYGKTGQKTELIRDYFNHHEYLLNQYDYFFVIDEISSMTAMQINSLFEEMAKDSSEFSLVGMTMPCFRKELMKQLLSDNPDKTIVYF